VQLKDGQDYNMLLAVNGLTATLVINNSSSNVLSFAFTPRVIDGYSYDLNTGMVGIGGNKSRAQIDNGAVRAGAAGNTAGIVFDYYDSNNFKFAGVIAGSSQVVIGHHTQGGWVIDATISRSILPGVDYNLSVSLKGTTASVSVNGQAAVGHVFNAAVTDAQAGLFTRGGDGSFGGYTIKTDDRKFG
jgi:hypothetical protein